MHDGFDEIVAESGKDAGLDSTLGIERRHEIGKDARETEFHRKPALFGPRIRPFAMH